MSTCTAQSQIKEVWWTDFYNSLVQNNAVHAITHLVDDVEFLFRQVKLERRVGTDKVDLVVEVHFNNVIIPTRFESEII